MKKWLFLLCVTGMYAQQPQKEITQLLDEWHLAAANAKFETYLDAMTPDAVFIGTDASEHWNIPAFKAFAKPYFDKGKAWSFKAVDRHIYFSEDGKIAWFDELLDTQMKLCRGSGVVKNVDGQWKIAQYVLSMTIPNEDIEAVLKIKTPREDAYLKKLQSK